MKNRNPRSKATGYSQWSTFAILQKVYVSPSETFCNITRFMFSLIENQRDIGCLLTEYTILKGLKCSLKHSQNFPMSNYI